MCCSSVLRILLPAAQLANTPNLLVLPHTVVFCCRAWNSMQYMNSPYASACGRIEAPYPDRASLVCYLGDPCYSSSLIRPRFSVFGVRFSGPDSGPRCCYLGPWPVFWARFWGLFFEFFSVFLLKKIVTRVSAWKGFVKAVVRCLLQVAGVLGLPVHIWGLGFRV